MNQKQKITCLNEKARAVLCNNEWRKETNYLLFDKSIDTMENGIRMLHKNEVVSVLPDEIIYNILSRLTVEDVMRCRGVCKSWYDIPKDRHFVDLHLSRAVASRSCIILEPGSRDPISSFFLIDTGEGVWRGREIPVEYMRENDLYSLCSFNGLICLAGSKLDPIYIYNPITKEHVVLPNADPKSEKNYEVNIAFGFEPTTKEYKTVRLYQVYPDDVTMPTLMKGEILTLGGKSWRALDVPYTVRYSTWAKPLFLDGAFHWIIDRKVHPGFEAILVLDICSEKFRTIKFPSSVNLPDQLVLVKLGECLALVELDSWDQFHVWRIVRANTRKGYKFFESSYNIGVTTTGLYSDFNIMGRLNDGNFLFHVKHMKLMQNDKLTDRLVLYCPKENEYKFVVLSGIPRIFIAVGFFIPSFVSPSAAIKY